jgi:hypothetical protein
LLRLVNPALIQPDFYDASIVFSPESRRKLLLITKVRFLVSSSVGFSIVEMIDYF